MDTVYGGTSGMAWQRRTMPTGERGWNVPSAAPSGEAAWQRCVYASQFLV